MHSLLSRKGSGRQSKVNGGTAKGREEVVEGQGEAVEKCWSSYSSPSGFRPAGPRRPSAAPPRCPARSGRPATTPPPWPRRQTNSHQTLRAADNSIKKKRSLTNGPPQAKRQPSMMANVRHCSEGCQPPGALSNMFTKVQSRHKTCSKHDEKTY